MQAARARSLALMEQQVKPALESFSVGEGEGDGAGWQWVLVGVSRRASGPLDNTCCIAPGPPPPNGCCQTHGSFTPRSSSPNAATTPTTPRRHEDAGQLEVLLFSDARPARTVRMLDASSRGMLGARYTLVPSLHAHSDSLQVAVSSTALTVRYWTGPLATSSSTVLREEARTLSPEAHLHPECFSCPPPLFGRRLAASVCFFSRRIPLYNQNLKHTSLTPPAL
jgi:hypothetical protein